MTVRASQKHGKKESHDDLGSRTGDRAAGAHAHTHTRVVVVVVMRCKNTEEEDQTQEAGPGFRKSLRGRVRCEDDSGPLWHSAMAASRGRTRDLSSEHGRSTGPRRTQNTNRSRRKQYYI